ncbi:putative Zn(II)2Cys6 transcription factor [Cladophialophora carrionii]|uniref:Putative Zn(II)2Cys6 transcription factor n=1 Tax=Cladophialophora carrionii TaxID=86049 RepID=A0A1C1CFW7_9EURO|nr:putative Zn(II)2Cys6 transcription factor [Cladophialophora carrionii]
MSSGAIENRPALNPLKRPRQDPVSCRFCRSKKLKCNRQSPCSNCSSRGLPCDGTSASYARRPLEATGDAGELSILARLKRLEDVVLGPPPSESKLDGIGASVSHGLPTKATSSPSLACVSPASEYQEAIHSLEETGARDAPSSFRGLDIRLMSTHQIAVDQDKLFNLQTASRCLCLPPKAEARALFDHYFEYVDLLQDVVHAPTVRASLQTVYASLESGLPVVPSEVVLLLAIFASAAGLCTYFPGQTRAFMSSTDALQASAFWANSALEVLEFSRRMVARRLADIQASIILGFLLFHNEGFSTRARCLFASGVAMARELSLHKIDAPGNPASGLPNNQNALETEIKRRVWWHTAATDWYVPQFIPQLFPSTLTMTPRLLGLSGGPQEGTYFVQPRHMRVNMLRNVDDDDLVRDGPPVDRPLSEPTAMSYYIQRIKLADICRQVIDVMPLTSFELGTVDYQDVINLDRKFAAFFRELPAFLKIDERHIRESEHIMRQRPHLHIQRYALGMIAQTRRCKLHQPFLIRRSVERHYDYSRRISLESARSVIRLKDLLHPAAEGEEEGGFVTMSARHTGIVYHIFMATIVLVMDLCFNRVAEGEDDAARKAEVVAACKMLEDAKSESAMASSFLDSLMDVLRKHKVRLHSINNNNNNNNARPSVAWTVPSSAIHEEQRLPVVSGWSRQPLHGVVGEDLNRPAPALETQAQILGDSDSNANANANATSVQDASQHYLSDFDAIWQEYVELGPNMGIPGWDSLFSDLDSRF